MIDDQQQIEDQERQERERDWGSQIYKMPRDIFEWRRRVDNYQFEYRRL